MCRHFFASTLTDLTIVQGYQGASVVVSRGNCASVVCFGGDSYETEKLLRTLRSRGVRHIEAAVSAGVENSDAGDMTASYLRYIHAGTAVYDRSDLHNMPLDVICEKKAIPAFDLAGARITTQMTGHIAVDGEGRDRTITLSIGRNVIVIGADADTVQAAAQAANAQIVILQKKNPGNIEKLSAKYVILLDKPSQSIYSGKEVVAGEAGRTLRLRLRANGRLKLETMD